MEKWRNHYVVVLMQVNHALVVIFSVANTSFNAIREKKSRENFRIYSR